MLEAVRRLLALHSLVALIICVVACRPSLKASRDPSKQGWSSDPLVDVLVWEDDLHGDHDLYLTTLEAPAPTRVTCGGGRERHPHLVDTPRALVFTDESVGLMRLELQPGATAQAWPDAPVPRAGHSALVDPSGALVAMTSGKPGLNVLGIDGTHRFRFAPSDCGRAGWSGDGRRLTAACEFGVGGVVVLDADGALLGRSADWGLAAGAVHHPALDATGERVVFTWFATPLARLIVVTLATKQTEIVYELREKTLAMPAWSRDGTRIVFTENSGRPMSDGLVDHDLRVLDLRTREVISVLPGPNHPRNPQLLSLTRAELSGLRLCGAP